MTSFRKLMRREIATHWRNVWQAIPEVVRGKDPEAVHQVRVSSRRLRAAMDAAVGVYPERWYKSLHRTAKEITRALGEVRDRDVLLEALGEKRKVATDHEKLAIDRLVKAIRRERKQARKRMVVFLERLDAKSIRKKTRKRFGRART